MDNVMSLIIKLVKYLIGFSRINSQSLCIKLESNAIFVNDVSYEFNNYSFSTEDIRYILNEFLEMGADLFEHAENAIVFKDASLLLESSVRN